MRTGDEIEAVNHESVAGVTEVQGLYGPLQILETRIHEIWALQQLQQGDWRCRGGCRLQVADPGNLNRGAGPDFRDAVILLNDQRHVGDIELHLQREDWWRHGHDLDARYDRVLLHVVLFPGGMDRPVLTSSGLEPAEWVMGPWLMDDVESLSGGEPGIFGEFAPELHDWMAQVELAGIERALLTGADRRFDLKESMAHSLIREHGPEGAAHRLFLYYLGFPHDRRAFLEIADAYPVDFWRKPGIIDAIQEEFATRIHWNWGRPGNRPMLRLRQYQMLHFSVPGWIGNLMTRPSLSLNPESLASAGALDTYQVRHHRHTAREGIWFRDDLFRGLLPQSLLDRLWIDVALPLRTAAGAVDRRTAALYWFHARPGPFPEGYRRLLRKAGISTRKGFILANGWIQGLLWQEDQLRLQRVGRQLKHAG